MTLVLVDPTFAVLVDMARTSDPTVADGFCFHRAENPSVPTSSMSHGSASVAQFGIDIVALAAGFCFLSRRSADVEALLRACYDEHKECPGNDK